MKEALEGSLILEKLAQAGLVDEFYEAVDSDDIPQVVTLLREASVDEDEIREVLEEIGHD